MKRIERIRFKGAIYTYPSDAKGLIGKYSRFYGARSEGWFVVGSVFGLFIRPMNALKISRMTTSLSAGGYRIIAKDYLG